LNLCHNQAMQLSALTIALIIATFLCAGVVKGVVGVGFQVVGMGLLGLAMPLVEAAALIVIPSLVTNLWQMLVGAHLAALGRRLVSMMLGICLGTAVGISLLTGGATHAASAALGAVLLLYGLASLWAVRFSVTPSAERWLSPLMGAITGALTGATGVFVIPSVPYLSALGLHKDELIQAMGMSFTVSTLALGVGLFAHGQFQFAVAATSLACVAPAVAGMWLGQRLRRHLNPEKFRFWFLLALVLLGAYMLARAAKVLWV
jgi:uncharacterized protein